MRTGGKRPASVQATFGPREHVTVDTRNPIRGQDPRTVRSIEVPLLPLNTTVIRPSRATDHTLQPNET